MTRKTLTAAALLSAALLTGTSLISAQAVKELQRVSVPKLQFVADDTQGADAAQGTENANAADILADSANQPNMSSMPENGSRSYSVIVQSQVGPDGKTIQKKKVWKDGVLVEDEEKTLEGNDASADATDALAPGIVIHSERNGQPVPDDFDALGMGNAAEMMKQMEARMKRQQEEMMRRFGMSGNFGPDDSFFNVPGQSNDALPSMQNAQPLSAYWIGAMVTPIPAETAYQFDIPEGEGVLVREICPGSPAEKAGLQRYDLLIKLGDETITQDVPVGQIVDKTEGATQTATIYRKGKLETLEITPEKRPEANADLPDLNKIPTVQDAQSAAENESIRVVRPGMILPAAAPEQEAPAAPAATVQTPESTQNNEAAPASDSSGPVAVPQAEENSK